jgi:hypothetical protein
MSIEAMIELIGEYAGEHPRFDDAVLISVAGKYERDGEITPAQEDALRNIISRFNMEDWKDYQ